MKQSRKVGFRTILSLANHRPIRFRIFLALFCLPLLYLIAVFILLNIPINNDFTDFERMMFYFPAFPFLGYGVLFGVYFFFILYKQVNLCTNGEVRDAEIISLMPTLGISSSFFGSRLRVLYRYQISGNNMVEGESITSDLSIIKYKKRGDTIKIFVSPKNEFITCVVSMIDVQRNNWEIE
jgi:hypothetical protein